MLEKLAKYDKAAADKMVIPAVGDIVYTKHFQFKDKRYYVDKQAKCKDLVKNQLELRLKEFDMLFLIDNYDIESDIIENITKSSKKPSKELLPPNKKTKISSLQMYDTDTEEIPKTKGKNL